MDEKLEYRRFGGEVNKMDLRRTCLTAASRYPSGPGLVSGNHSGPVWIQPLSLLTCRHLSFPRVAGKNAAQCVRVRVCV